MWLLQGEDCPTKRLQTDACGFGSALNAIGGKWKTAILWQINMRPRRFGELRRLLPGISEKVLAQHLHEMEADDLVHRQEFPGAVRRVEYSVTELGRSLNAAVAVMSEWGNAHEKRRAAKAAAQQDVALIA